MDSPNTDVHRTARDWFLVKVINGAIPEVWEGIRFFPVATEEGGETYWLTEAGLLEPPPLWSRGSL